MSHYTVWVRRDNGTIDTYRQRAADVLEAIALTRSEFEKRNNLYCAPWQVVLVVADGVA